MPENFYTRSVSVIKFIIYNIIAVAVLLLFINWISGIILKKTRDPSRSTLPNYQENPKYAENIFNEYGSLGFEYEPFVGWKCKPYNGKTTTINVEGLRTHTAPEQIPDSASNIRFFEGSTMWGEGSDDRNTIPALFNQMNPEYNVFNHAQLAYNTRQNLDALITLYEENERSDIVIFYDGVNDTAFLCPSDVDVPGHRLVPTFRERIYITKTFLAKKIFYELFLEKTLRLIEKYKQEDKSELYNCYNNEKAEQIADFFITNWEIAHQIVSQNGGRFIAILQPVAFLGNPKIDHLDFEPEFKRNVIEVYSLIRKRLKEKDYPWVYDLTDSFNKSEYIYIDFCHVSPNGNQIIAEDISKIFTKYPPPTTKKDSQ